MAKLPTNEEVERAILDAVSSYNIRPNETVPLMGVQMILQKLGYRAEDFYSALERMGSKGWIANAKSPNFIVITEAGFAEM